MLIVSGVCSAFMLILQHYNAQSNHIINAFSQSSIGVYTTTIVRKIVAFVNKSRKSRKESILKSGLDLLSQELRLLPIYADS